ncbi:hypothetical protein N752_26590 [Desulforamulus aquiferis]|nr:S-layer homology domain-containing protein [Desulforamulus aquiferis]RYD02023.1 hypothetical protein N752_26590 [Desulforamulus aquiferis]
MQKLISYMLLGAFVLGSAVCWPIELGQADEIAKAPVQQLVQESEVISTATEKPGPVEVKKPEIIHITRGEAAEKLVNALDLNLDAYRFFKAPEVSDFFDDVSQGSSFAKAIMILGYNGAVDTSERSFRPSDKINREEMAQMLGGLLRNKAKNSLEDNSVNSSSIKDLAQARSEAINDILTVVGSNVMTLKEGKFQPKQHVTPREFEAIVKKLSGLIEVKNEEVTAKILVNKEGNREVELTWGEKPSSGYEVRIEELVIEDSTLIVKYSTQEPDPAHIIPQ